MQYVKEFHEWSVFIEMLIYVSIINTTCKIVPDFAAVVYSAGIHYGGQLEWDYVWNKTKATVVVSENEIMLTALGRTQQPWLLWR